jgi:cysteine-rich repeat protein
VRRALVIAGTVGRSQVWLRAAGDALQLPELASIPLPITVQLKSTSAANPHCWTAEFGHAETQNAHVVRAERETRLPDARPNILVVNLDDTRADGIDRMPNLAQLASESVSFSNSFVVNPLCAPSRASLFTGLYARHHGVHTLSGARRFRELGSDRQTIAVWMHEAGYRTGLFGKYVNGYGYGGMEQVIGPGGTYYVPPGWTRWRVMPSPEHYGGEHGATYSLIDEYGHPTVYGDHATDRQYSTDVTAAEVRAFIAESVGQRRPFFAVWTPYASHAEQPSFVPEPAARHFGFFRTLPSWNPPSYGEADVALGNNFAAVIYNALIRRGAYETLLAVDEQLQSIRDDLVDLGVDDNTVIIFTSDNGTMWGEHGLYAQAKECPYEECLRVPMIVHDPRTGVAGVVREAPVLNVDIAPTVAALAGVVPPVPLDGASFAAWLSTTAPALWRDDFPFEHWRSDRGDTLSYTAQVSDGDQIRMLYGPTHPLPRLSALFEFDDGSGVSAGAVAVPIGATPDDTFNALGVAVAASVPFARAVPIPARGRINFVDDSPNQDGLYLYIERDQGSVIAHRYVSGDFYGVRDVTGNIAYVEHESGEKELYDLDADPTSWRTRRAMPDTPQLKAGWPRAWISSCTEARQAGRSSLCRSASRARPLGRSPSGRAVRGRSAVRRTKCWPMRRTDSHALWGKVPGAPAPGFGLGGMTVAEECDGSTALGICVGQRWFRDHAGLGVLQTASAEVDLNGPWSVGLYITRSSLTFSDICSVVITQTTGAFVLSGNCNGVANPVTLNGMLDAVTGAFTASGAAGACGEVTIRGNVAGDSASFNGAFDCPSLGVSGGINANRCGNGQLDANETCDDGNRLNGDCCAAVCRLYAEGAACTDDGSPCTTDVCNATGQCQHTPLQGACDDGNDCTAGDTCLSGRCVGTVRPDHAACDDGNNCTSGDECEQGICTAEPVVCGPCLECNVDDGCVPAIANGCRQASATSITLRRSPNDAVSWRWELGDATRSADLGDPTAATDYDFCVYDGRTDATGSPGVVAAARAPGGGNWFATHRGFAYTRPDLTPDGVRRILLNAGPGGKSRMWVKGLGPALALPPLDGVALPLTVQLKSRRGDSAPQCWTAEYSQPLLQTSQVLRAGRRTRPPDTRPNILVVNLDDTRADGIDHMPNLARLAQQSVTFTNSFVVNPLCAPSRASLFSGLYARHHGVRALGGAIGGAHRFRELGSDRQTIAVWLHEAGYRTGLFGKYINGYGFGGVSK